MTSLVQYWRAVPRLRNGLIVAAVLALAAVAGLRASKYWLVLSIAALGGALLLQSPGLGLVVLTGLSFTLPLTFGTGSEVALTAPVFLVPLVVVVWLADGLRQGVVRLPSSRTITPLILFVGSGLISLIAGTVYWSPNVHRPDNLLLIQLAQWAIFALSATILIVTGDLAARDGGRWLRYATWLFLALGSVVVLEALLPSSLRILGWSDPEMANRSMFWIWLPALALGQLLFNRSLRTWHRLGLGVLLLLAGYYLVIVQRTWSSGWVPFLVAVAIVVMLWVWRRSKALAAVVALVVVLLLFVLSPILFQHAGGERELEISWGGREKLYAATLDVVKDHPILGLGPAAYRHYGFSRWLSLGVGRALYIQPLVSSHNNYLDIYAQQGLVGLALFVWFLIEVGLLGWRLRPRFQSDFNEGYVNGALAGLGGTLVAMMLADWFLPFVYNIGFPGFRTSALAWMFLGGLVALEQLSSQPSKPQTSILTQGGD